jgi:hypothetical protein
MTDESVAIVYTAEDFLDGQRLHTRASPRTRIGLGVVLALAFVSFLLWEPDHGAVIFASLLGVVGGVLVYGLFYGLYLPTVVRRAFANYPRAKAEHVYRLEPEGLRIATSNGAGLSPWSDFIAWRGDGRTTILYTSPRLFLILPARLEDLGFPYAQMQARLAENVKRRP